MSVDTVSFWLKPSGFFDRNPSIDAPPTVKAKPGSCHG
jgi:primary-amine oxidase